MARGSKLRRGLLAGALALGLALPSAAPRAQAIDLDDLGDILKILEAMLDEMTLEDTMPGFAQALLDRVLDFIGVFPNSYLPDGADLEVIYPDEPTPVTPGDNKFLAKTRQDDRRARATEAINFGAELTRQLPTEATELLFLEQANQVPLTLLAALQLGNAITASAVRGIHKMEGLLAEALQLHGDEEMARAQRAYESVRWAEGHYRHNRWTGVRTWETETINPFGGGGPAALVPAS